MNLKPLEDRIVVRPSEAEETTVSGIVIPDTAKEKPQQGEVLAAGPVLVALTFLVIRSFVRSGGHRARAGAGAAAAVLALSVYGALGFGGLEAYSDSACSRYVPNGFGDGTYVKGTGLWPPGLECRFYGPAGQRSTHRSGFDAVWQGAAATGVISTTMALGVVALDQARRRFGWAPTSMEVGPSAL